MKVALTGLAAIAHFLTSEKLEDLPVVIIDHKPGPVEDHMYGNIQPETNIPLTNTLIVPPSFREDNTLRWFSVKGVSIQARSRKLAEKIYRIRLTK